MSEYGIVSGGRRENREMEIGVIFWDSVTEADDIRVWCCDEDSKQQ